MSIFHLMLLLEGRVACDAVLYGFGEVGSFYGLDWLVGRIVRGSFLIPPTAYLTLCPLLTPIRRHSVLMCECIGAHHSTTASWRCDELTLQLDFIHELLLAAHHSAFNYFTRFLLVYHWTHWRPSHPQYATSSSHRRAYPLPILLYRQKIVDT